MNHLSTHILDTARGSPAAEVVVVLEAFVNGVWTVLGDGVTDADGRVKNLLNGLIPSGLYRLRFATGDYFERIGQPVFYPEVIIVVQLDSAVERYHLPLLLSPYSYSTYRGS